MSRAFVRDADDDSTELHERPVSSQPNFVTAEGLRQIESEVRRLEQARHAAAGDPAEAARLARDLRYWQKRYASARLVVVAADPQAVRFGVRVTLETEDGGERAWRLVGEDEADPAAGKISWASPLARSLLGRTVGDAVEFLGQRAEIVRLQGAEDAVLPGMPPPPKRTAAGSPLPP